MSFVSLDEIIACNSGQSTKICNGSINVDGLANVDDVAGCKRCQLAQTNLEKMIIKNSIGGRGRLSRHQNDLVVRFIGHEVSVRDGVPNYRKINN